MPDLNTTLQTIADTYTEKGLYAGIGWRVEQAGDVLSSGVSGTSDESRVAALSEDAIYRIFSMTKPIISVMTILLVQRGQVRLSDFVQQYIPSFADTEVLTASGTEPLARPITIEDLLTHRSGLSYDFQPGCPVAEQYAKIDLITRVDKSLAEYVDLIATFPLASQPGTQWHYSVSTDVLARVLEVASGQSLDQLLQDNIFTPLGMTDTGFYVPQHKQSRLLPLFGFENIDLSYRVPPPHDLVLLNGEAIYPSKIGHNALRGGHGLFSTCADYIKFSTMLLHGKLPDGTPLIAPAMHQLMVANRLPEHQKPLKIGPIRYPGYGFCLIGRVMQDLGQAMSLTGAQEFGWEGAAGTFFWVDPKNQLVGVVMTQFLATYLPFREDMRAAVYTKLAM